MNLKRMVALILLLPLGFAGVWNLQKRIDVQQSALEAEDDQMMLRSSKLVKVMSLEYAPLVDITPTPDPQLMPVYHFGSMYLSDAPPRGAGRPDLAVQLIERGVRANPEHWRLYYDLGFVYYFDMKDYLKASAAFYEGSKNPKALIWMKVMAAKIAAEGSSVGTSLFLWQDVYNTTRDPQVKENALTHLQLLRAQEDCKQIDGLAEQYRQR